MPSWLSSSAQQAANAASRAKERSPFSPLVHGARQRARGRGIRQSRARVNAGKPGIAFLAELQGQVDQSRGHRKTTAGVEGGKRKLFQSTGCRSRECRPSAAGTSRLVIQTTALMTMNAINRSG